MRPLKVRREIPARRSQRVWVEEPESGSEEGVEVGFFVTVADGVAVIFGVGVNVSVGVGVKVAEGFGVGVTVVRGVGVAEGVAVKAGESAA